MITAPYNFVPLNEKVFYPFWDKDISHDIPFEDGESGILTIKVKAETSIYVRNHYTDGDDYYKDKKGNKISTEFCHFKDNTGGKQYYIPATSIKGMIRNIIEIMSFSKIKVDKKVLSQSLSVRDMTPSTYCQDNTIKKMKDCPDNLKRNLYESPIVATAKKCGFLIKRGENYFIEDCGNIINISEQEIKNIVPNYNKNIETASKKYIEFGHNNNFSFKTEQQDRRTVAIYNQRGTKNGSLVMTGFIDNKKYEFIFENNTTETSINKKIYEDFKKVYFDNEDSIDGQYWKREWDNGNGRKIPIFYIEENKKISAIGLTQIFKLKYNKTLLDASNQTIKKDRLDLSEVMFGTVKDDLALKGRIQFSHLKSTHVSYEKEKNEILGSPQATYYPNYLEQTDINGNKVNKYKTLMDTVVKISGYKRYPLHKGIKKSFISKEEKTNIQTKFKPLSKGATFKGKIRFHNLKKVEIGALLSALTFHGQNGYRHSLGMAKSLGYGKIKIDIELQNLKYTKEEYLKAYEEEMTIFQDNWIQTAQLKELFSMSNNDIVNDKSLEYQKLENPLTRDKEKNDFVRAKKNREYLKRYSQIGNVNEKTLNSFVDNNKIEEEKKIRKNKEEQLKLLEKELKDKKLQEEKAKKEEQDKWNSIHNPSNSKYLKDTLTKFISDYPNSSKVKDAKKELENLTQKTEKVTNKTLDFDNATDSKSIERAMKPIQNPTDDDKQKLENIIIKIYPKLNAKKKKQFLKSTFILRWLGKDRLNSLLVKICLPN